MTAYADTSFLVSLYTPDANSAPAAARMSQATLPVLITSLGELELTNALQLRLFRRDLTAAEIKAASAAFRKDVESGVFALHALPAVAFARALQLARRRTPRLGPRTLDILHVASALVLRVHTFYTFDRTQRKLAQVEGLATP